MWVYAGTDRRNLEGVAGGLHGGGKVRDCKVYSPPWTSFRLESWAKVCA